LADTAERAEDLDEAAAAKAIADAEQAIEDRHADFDYGSAAARIAEAAAQLRALRQHKR
jgi:F-type H+-transporting ATPase subunit epsilon